LIRGHQHHMVHGLLFPTPIANHAGVKSYVTPIPDMLNAPDKSHVLLVS
jgi:hypothetical protein